MRTRRWPEGHRGPSPKFNGTRDNLNHDRAHRNRRYARHSDCLSRPTFGAGLDDMCGLREPGLREVADLALSVLLVGHGLLFPLSRSPQAGSAGYSSRNARTRAGPPFAPRTFSGATTMRQRAGNSARPARFSMMI